MAPNEGIKYDGEKPRWWLLPWKQVEDVVKVLTFGAKKYSEDNWQQVQPIKERYHSACLRHITAWRMGEVIDPESGLPHLAHAVCCLLFMMWADDNLKEGE